MECVRRVEYVVCEESGIGGVCEESGICGV